MLHIDRDVAAKLQAELMPGEKLLWADKPRKANFLWILLPGMLVGPLLVVFGLGLFSTSLLGLEGGWFHTLFSLVWLTIPAIVTVLSVRGFFAPSKQIYGLTNERGIIIQNFMGRRIASLHAAEFSKIERKGDPQIGTLHFGGAPSFAQMGMTYQSPLTSFSKIQNPREVEALIRKTFSKRHSHE